MLFFFPPRFFYFFLFCLLLSEGLIFAQPTEKKLTPAKICLGWSEKIKNGSLLVEDASTQKTLCSFRSYEPFIPASIVKIPLSLVALKKLGPFFHFETNLFLDGQNNLVLQGKGDPFFTSEEVLNLALQMKKKGWVEFQHLYFDTQIYAPFPVPGVVDSEQPYDAILSPISVNFNTIFIEKLPNGKIQSAESQTPSLPIMIEKGKNLALGEKNRINIGKEEKDVLLYAHQLFLSLFRSQNIHIQSDAMVLLPPEAKDLKPLFVYSNSQNLSEILPAMLRFSNNMQANSILMQIGMNQFGYPGTLDKGLEVMQESLKNDFGLQEKEFSLVEGSGIARENQFSAQAMMKVLRFFQPFFPMLHFKKGAWVKSGTLTGVYNYAGYIPVENKIYRFVLILNQPGNYRDQILDSLVRDLKTGLKTEGF